MMTVYDMFEETRTAILSNKVRSGLTILGIVIGIASVIAMISIGKGAQQSVETRIQSIGSNLLLVSPGNQRSFNQISSGRGSAQTLTQADADAMTQEITLIQAIAPEDTRRYQITAKGNNTNTQVVGTVSQYSLIRNIEMDSGAFITDQSVREFSKVAILGPIVRDDLFGQDIDAIGQFIRINHIDFKVIGITKSKGGTGFGNQDDRVFVPISTVQHFLSGNNYVTTISVSVRDQNSMTETQNEITSLLLSRHHISNPQLADFNVLNQADIVATASSVTNTFTILLGSIAGISLLVGGIGIMNMMLTAVTERTREIGLRKAIGAKKKEIILQFLIEAVMLTFIGGIIGIFLGWVLAILVKKITGIDTQLTLIPIILASFVSAAIGIIFGFYPARRAANLNPIDALRYE